MLLRASFEGCSLLLRSASLALAMAHISSDFCSLQTWISVQVQLRFLLSADMDQCARRPWCRRRRKEYERKGAGGVSSSKWASMEVCGSWKGLFRSLKISTEICTRNAGSWHLEMLHFWKASFEFREQFVKVSLKLSRIFHFWKAPIRECNWYKAYMLKLGCSFNNQMKWI